MKIIFKVLLITLIAAVLSQCKKDNDSYVTIPDNNFLNALIALGVDSNSDSIISPVEAEAVTVLGLDIKNISDLTGISAFVNLEKLFCANNHLTSLKLKENTALTELVCYDNQLTSLDVSNNPDIEWLRCGGNQITTLDVSNNISLTYLSCGSNLLTGLDVSNNNTLNSLEINEMPSLIKVCVWTMPFPPAGLKLDTTGSLNVYFTTDCSK